MKSMHTLSSRVLLSLTALLPGLQRHVRPLEVFILAIAVILATPAAVCAEDVEVAPPPAKPMVREVSPGVFEVGKVRLDQKARSISFSGVLKMKRGLLEYLMVNPKGSVHDQMWNVNGETTPGVGTPVEIIFKLVPPEDTEPSKK